MVDRWHRAALGAVGSKLGRTAGLRRVNEAPPRLQSLVNGTQAAGGREGRKFCLGSRAAAQPSYVAVLAVRISIFVL